MVDRGAAEGFSEPTAPPRHVATARCNQVFYSADGGATYRWDHAQRHPRADAAARAHGAISGYRVGHTVAAHVLANDADSEGDIDPWSVGVVVPGALGVAAPRAAPTRARLTTGPQPRASTWPSMRCATGSCSAPQQSS